MSRWRIECRYLDPVTGRTAIGEASISNLARGDKTIRGRPKLAGLLRPALQLELRTYNPRAARGLIHLIRRYWQFLDDLTQYGKELGQEAEIEVSTWKEIEASWRQWILWLQQQDISQNERARIFWFVRKIMESGFRLEQDAGRISKYSLFELFGFFRHNNSIRLVDTLEIADVKKISKRFSENWHIAVHRIEHFRMIASDGTPFRENNPNQRVAVNHWRKLSNVLWFVRQYFPWGGRLSIPRPIKNPDGCFDGVPPPDWEPITPLKRRKRWILFGGAIYLTREDLYLAIGLVAIKTPLNPSVIGSLRASKWFVKDPQYPTKRVVIFARKARAGGELQKAYSRVAPKADPYQIISKVIELTEPLRDLARKEAKQLRQKKRRTRSDDIELQRLERLSDAVWLFPSRRYGVDDLGRTLGNSASSDMKLLYSRLLRGIFNKDGKPVKFSLRDGRHFWALHLYERSGHNITLTQYALGHKGLGTILRYLNDRQLRIRTFVRLAKLHEHVFEGLENAVFNARHLRKLVADGVLNSDAAKRLQYSRTSIFGFHCFDPLNPTKEADPGHVAGHACIRQLCMLCTKWYATAACLPFLLRAIQDLDQIERETGILVWETSSYPLWRALFTEITGRFHPTLRSKAALIAETMSPIIAPSRFVIIGGCK